MMELKFLKLPPCVWEQCALSVESHRAADSVPAAAPPSGATSTGSWQRHQG